MEDITTLPPIQQLDKVLGILQNFSKSIQEIQKELKLDTKPETFQQVRLILNKLKKDEYADEVESFVPDRLGVGAQEKFISYKITFEGSVFKASDGYAGERLLLNAENIRLERIEQKARANQKILMLLTIFVCLGTLAQAIYALVELYWKYHWFH